MLNNYSKASYWKTSTQTAGPVLVDEAHNFRNINNRSLGLRHYLDSGAHKVVLLSATPQNLGPMDIYRQLTLFMDDTEHGLNVEPVSLNEYFRNAQKVGWLIARNMRTTHQTMMHGGQVSRKAHHLSPLASRKCLGRKFNKCFLRYSSADGARISRTYMVILLRSMESRCASLNPS